MDIGKIFADTAGPLGYVRIAMKTDIGMCSCRRVMPSCAVLLLALAHPFRIHAAESWHINVVGDMYDDGRKVVRPTPDKPAYYYPIVHEFKEIGAGAAGEKIPAKKELIGHLAAVLSAEGYRVTYEVTVPVAEGGSASGGQRPAGPVKALAGPPTLVLVVDWGSIHPELLDGSLGGDATTSTAPPQVVNSGQMIGLTAGKDFDRVADFGLKTESIMQGIADDRYFVMISAYDFDAYYKSHRKVLLWVAKMSVPSFGFTMAEVMPSLIKSGGPLLGRETVGPQVISVPTVPEGRVEVGTPSVVGH